MGGDEFCALIDRPRTDGKRARRPRPAALSERGDGFTIGCSHGSVLIPTRRRTARRRSGSPTNECTHTSAADARPPHASPRMFCSARSRTKPRARHPRARCRRARRRDRRHVLTGPTRSSRSAKPPNSTTSARSRSPTRSSTNPASSTKTSGSSSAATPSSGSESSPPPPTSGRSPRLVRSSHENYDGTGYPDRLAGPDIPLGSRIIIVCDAFDAMTTNRPYRPSYRRAERDRGAATLRRQPVRSDRRGALHPRAQHAGNPNPTRRLTRGAGHGLERCAVVPARGSC